MAPPPQWHVRGWHNTRRGMAQACLAAVLLSLLSCCHAAVVSDKVSDAGKFHFVDKFCFDTTPLETAQGVRAGTTPREEGAIMRFNTFLAPAALVHVVTCGCLLCKR